MRFGLMAGALAVFLAVPAVALACGGETRAVEPRFEPQLQVQPVEQVQRVVQRPSDRRAAMLERTATRAEMQARTMERDASRMSMRARQLRLIASDMDGPDRTNLLIAAGELARRARMSRQGATRSHAQARNLRAQARLLRRQATPMRRMRRMHPRDRSALRI